MVDLVSLGGLLLAFFLVVMNGMFVAAEFAFVKVRPTQDDASIKQKFGAFVRSHRWWKQFRELVIKRVVHDIQRALAVAENDRESA